MYKSTLIIMNHDDDDHVMKNYITLNCFICIDGILIHLLLRMVESIKS